MIIDFLKERARNAINQVSDLLGGDIPYMNLDGMLRKYCRVLKHTNKEIFERKKSKKVVFMTSIGAMTYSSVYYDQFFGHALSLRGAQISYLLCDLIDYPCFYNVFANGIEDKDKNRRFCDNCIKSGRKQFAKTIFYQDIVYFSKYFDRTKWREVYSLDYIRIHLRSDRDVLGLYFKGINIGHGAYISTRRDLNLVDLDYDNNLVQLTLHNFLNRAAQLLEVFVQYLEKERPETVIIHDALHNMQSLMWKMCQRHKVNTCTYEFSYLPNSFNAARNKLVDYDYSQYWHDNLEHKQLDDQENAYVDQILSQRMAGEKVMYSFAINHEQDEHALLKELGFLPKAPSYVMFTNNPYDEFLEADNTSNNFHNFREWVVETVKYFAQTGKQLVIKPHPTEYLLQKKQQDESILGYILDVFGGKIPENIHILPRDTRISPYKLMKLFDRALIFYGTLGLELSCLGTPVIIATKSHLSGKGFVYEAGSRKEYYKLLDAELPKSLSLDKIELARRYFYLIFNRMQMVLPEIGVASTLKLGSTKFWNIERFEDLLPGKIRDLDVLCDGFLGKGEFLR